MKGQCLTADLVGASPAYKHELGSMLCHNRKDSAVHIQGNPRPHSSGEELSMLLDPERYLLHKATLKLCSAKINGMT